MPIDVKSVYAKDIQTRTKGVVMAKKQSFFAQLLRYFTFDIWEKEAGDFRFARYLQALSRWTYLVFKGFLGDQCLVRAGALTFTVTLSIVPFLAVAFSIAKGFGLQNKEFIHTLLSNLFSGNEEVVSKILEYIGNTSVVTLGWIGVAFLLLTVFSMVTTIEQAFNSIWKVKKGRSPWRKFTDFFSVMLIVPIIMVLAISASVSIQNSEMVQFMLQVSVLGWIGGVLLKLMPLFLLWLAFMFAYSFIPNTKVTMKGAAIGAAIASSMWLLIQGFYIQWQMGFNNYNAIYGSFAQLPLFLIWLYISWIIVLAGAEIAFAVQHLKAFTKQQFMRKASLVQRQKLAVLMLLMVAKPFEEGCRLPTVRELSDRLSVPTEQVMELFSLLADAGLAAQSEEDDEVRFVPAVNPARVRVTDVARAITAGGNGDTVLGQEYGFVDELFVALDKAEDASPANRTITEYLAELGDEGVCPVAEV